jgi:toxin secretion/phage lysis holin
MKDAKLTCMIAFPLNGLLNGMATYIFDDWEFVKWLVVLIVVDTILGLLKHWYAHDISSKGYGMVIKKLIVYSSVMILAHVLSNFKVGGEQVTALQWFGTFGCTILMVREGLSIIENIEAILPGFFPASIIKRFKDFADKGGKE